MKPAVARRTTKILGTGRVVRYRGRFMAAPSAAVVDVDAKAGEAMTIDADAVHEHVPGGARAFWMRTRSWKIPAKFGGGQLVNHKCRSMMPTWDRVAQAMLLMAQPVPRVVPEMAFRLFAVFLKVLMLQRIGDMALSLFPVTTAYQVRALIETGKHEQEKLQKEGKKPADAAAAGDGGKPASAGTEEKK